jgi:hypothetical protein
MFPRIPVLLVPLFLLGQSRAAESDGETYADPANAGPDFAFQGEYVGQGSAAQVIAEGEGKFRIVGFAPGLPGTSSEVEKKVEGPARREGNKVVIDSDGWQGQIVDGVLTSKNQDGNTYRLTKTERKSPTLGEKPPEGAVVLFDGSSTDQWEGGKLTAEGFLAVGVKSKRSFGSGKLHIEFRTPFMPKARGQARGNSGVYLQDRYEVQVLDSFGLKGENNECGGIYSIAKPKVNMAFPPLSWQTYDIDFEAAEYDATGTKTKPALITVRHNGMLIHERVEVSRGTTAAGRKEGADTGPIQLQNHGNPVVYRNIWFVPKS